MKVFSIYDSKAEVYWSPRFYLNAGVALREFSDAAQARNGDNELSAHPEDYTLFEIGDWDENTGELRTYPSKVALGVALEYANKKGPDKVSRIQGGAA